MPATAPVPPGAGTPPGIGPYELGGEAGGEITLTRSDTFADFDIPDIPRGNVEKITIQVVADAHERTLQVLDGELDSIQGPPAADLEPQIATEAGERYAQSPAASTTYAYLDRNREPFDDPSVREAVALGVDSTGCSLIPPGMTGYDHDFDTTGCAPDLDAARALIREAGAEDAPVKVSGTETDEYLRAASSDRSRSTPGGSSHRGDGTGHPIRIDLGAVRVLRPRRRRAARRSRARRASPRPRRGGRVARARALRADAAADLPRAAGPRA